AIPVALVRQEAEAVGDESKRAKNSGTLLVRPRVNQVSMLCSFQPSVDLLRVRHPLHQLLWRRAIGHQEGEDLLGRLDEKLTLLVLRRLEQGHRQSLRFGASAEFFRGSPIRATSVERIQDNVAVFRVIKAFDELPCGVVDDRGIATMFYLPKYLEHDHSLARSGISDDLHVLGFGPLRYADHCLHFVGLNAYAIPCDPVVELPWSHHLGAFQSSSVSQRLASSN